MKKIIAIGRNRVITEQKIILNDGRKLTVISDELIDPNLIDKNYQGINNMKSSWQTPRYKQKTLDGLSSLKQKNLDAKIKKIVCLDCGQSTPHKDTCIHCGEGLPAR